jgi:ATP-binding cassette subfamily E protein 1
MRIAVVKKDRCIAPKECNYLCIRLCPVVRAGKECIVVDEDKKPLVNEELCVGCGICVKKCPTEAIHIVNLPEELKKHEVHRFGKNAFRLYRMPIPIPNEVVGVLGPNGIGKTTAINIMSNSLRPNLGNLDSEVVDKDIINFFKGSEAQNFFTDLYSKNLKTSFKIQYVDAIPKHYSGKVIDLLKENDEKEILDNVVKDLELKEILDSDIKKISGGELQRVAIAATILKNADVYFFDEPSSYLDIKQRLNIAKFIRGMKNEKTSVTVIEHDLIVLDYLCDLIHVMYGKNGVYGVASHPYSCKEGINSYLEGFLRDENVRFREKGIEFRDKAPAKEHVGEQLISWEVMEKRLGRFRLKINPGTLFRNEVIGILGPNAIGKTTFAKILAGVIESDLDLNVKISYKPQYIDVEKGLVSDVIKRGGVSEKLITSLGVSHLMNRELNSLSGGELQTVAVIACLSRDADIYLLDEPSAYLDVEKRLKIADSIRNFVVETGKAAMIVDHDILFLDYLSDRLMVFSGKPAIFGETKGPFDMREGMNLFLKDIGITFRRDSMTKRPRANKLDSIKDKEQKKVGEYYYT